MVVLGEEMQNYNTATLGEVILVGTPGPPMGNLSANTSPYSRQVSSVVPPAFFRILILVKSTLFTLSMSTTYYMALRASGANSPELDPMILDAKLVFTHSINISSSVKSTLY